VNQSGSVIQFEFHVSWGNYLRIEYEDEISTLYAHNNQNLVSAGQSVEQGEIIATMGSTRLHLHFEISTSSTLVQDYLIDPMQVSPR
jgi:murein DD-endopeptidase MepM/ murein hydrolase activator NlpD